MPIEITVASPGMTISQGRTFMVTDQRGEINPSGDEGVYAIDTRFIDTYRLLSTASPGNWSMRASWVTGDFTMHGVTKSVTFDVEYGGQSNMAGAGPRAGLTATTKINRKDFGLNFGALAQAAGQVALGEIVTIEIDVEATTQSAPAQAVETAQ